MFGKKTNEMNKVLNEVTKLIEINEQHVKRLLTSCITFEQVMNLPDYVDQLCSNVKCISTHYKPCALWRKMYEKEVDTKLLNSRALMHTWIWKTYEDFIKR